MAAARLDQLLEDGGTNAALAWVLCAFVGLVAVESLLTGDLLWAGFAAAVLALVLVPAAAFRSAAVMLPWEVVLLATLPLVGRAFSTYALTTQVATYLSVAALALVVAVELDTFTPVRMTPWFAVLFVVIATTAAAGVWAVLQWTSDLYLGTTFVLDPALSSEEQEAAVMWDFVAATVSGLVAGVVFEWYFRRRSRVRDRLPDEVREAVE